MDQFPPTRRTQLKRIPKRGVYDKAAVQAILDEGLICHVGFALDGHTYVIPTGYVGVDDCLYIHRSPASRMLGGLSQANRRLRHAGPLG
jgi:nitroimidazol reductase NimA-like FMN-containing flavoprotein (pyridoxamine 5'-phosphate oxidase superfamily)